MRKLKIKGVVAITALSILLTGCQAPTENVSNSNEYESNVYIEEQIETQPEKDSTSEERVETAPILPNDNTLSETQQSENPITESSNQFTFFEDAKQEVIGYIESEEFENLKEKGKYYVTTGIDFIFFDEPINSLYFDSLTEELKADVIRDVKALDEAIMAYYPNYKESFSSKYQIASDFVSEQYLKVMDSIKEYLGEENYNAVGEIKDQITQDLGDAASNLWEDAKGLYKDWKNK